ncbi:NAD(P)/FAD-dependent oxidoreductase [Spirulina sp. CS-785/01]|uniref:beta-carotene ketolase CrtO n=1 Tax=Spirulina sp. CS-785/01 TaxID=3021716 RepID=UPI00232BB436|nr:NAD(P)/FAD-dependent oxidoreductase [Spirulina sp. CS-785/01]MDB9315862.1 NAD(P)/FAD-dependent oxidoreductase [Spirulina sp. CS-785/01]
METYDIIIIGAGHNGLVCAAYLLKAGYTVLLLEKRPVPGGAATTEELLPETAPGFQFNRCAIDHEFIHLSPVLEELELHRYGLKYLPCDPVLFSPHPNGTAFLAHRSVEETCQAIAQYNKRDAQQYAQFIQHWDRIAGAITPLFNAPPMAILDILNNYEGENWQDLLGLLGTKPKALDVVRNLLTSPTDLLNEWFDSETIKAPLARLAAEMGAPPSQKGMAVGAMMMAMRHSPGMSRPQGGTRALIAALVKLVQEKGGKILTEQTVEKILVDDGKAVGVQVQTGQDYQANKGVIANVDARRVFSQLVDSGDFAAIAPQLRDRVERRIVNNNNSLLKIDCALNEPPRFDAYHHQDDYLVGSVIIADSVAHVEKSCAPCAYGEIPDHNPSMYVVCPTILDPSMAPDGKHTLWIEFFAPYRVAGHEGLGFKGTGWTDDLKNRVADRVLEKLATYAPNIKRSLIARHVESPAELGERLGAYHGNCYHMDMSLDQMLFLRPLPELADYKTPIQGLFLTGAGTHPGGSISGMPGRNCARMVIHSQHPLVERFSEAQSYVRSLLQSVLKTLGY